MARRGGFPAPFIDKKYNYLTHFPLPGNFPAVITTDETNHYLFFFFRSSIFAHRISSLGPQQLRISNISIVIRRQYAVDVTFRFTRSFLSKRGYLLQSACQRVMP
jgi:hypothetical protein